jgi:hypothetical protein
VYLIFFLLKEILTPGSESRNLLKKMGKINNEIIIRKHREPSRGHEWHGDKLWEGRVARVWEVVAFPFLVSSSSFSKRFLITMESSLCCVYVCVPLRKNEAERVWRHWRIAVIKWVEDPTWFASNSSQLFFSSSFSAHLEQIGGVKGGISGKKK